MGKQAASGPISQAGGEPWLPADIVAPACTLCAKPLTFYLQVVFPNDHAWSGKTLSLFAASACAHEKHPIPKMLDGALKGVDVPGRLLRDYQTNFRVFVFDTASGAPRPELRSWVDEQPLPLKRGSSPTRKQWSIDAPAWIVGDEAPSSLDGRDSVFLLQVPGGAKFRTRNGAPRQMQWVFTEELPSLDSHYELFLGNHVYFWGTRDADPQLVYILTQR